MTTVSQLRHGAGAGRENQCRSAISFFVFVLRFTEPGGVTVPGRADPDAEAERDRAHVLLDLGPDGKPQLPGTSIAGALREEVRVRLGGTVAGDLFGRLLEDGGGDEEVDARASRIWVLGSRLREDVTTGFRASTKISRERAAAQQQTLRVEELLPAGSTFEVFLRWDSASPEEIEELAELLARWRPLIGRGVSRGRGRCVVDEVRHGTLDLDQPRDLLRWLAGSGPALGREVAVHEVRTGDVADPEPVIRVPLSIAGPWRIGNGPKTEDLEFTPMLRVGGQFVVPGTSLKGVVRSRAEFILRSIGVTPRPCEEQQCGTCWACVVFGHGGGQDETSESVGARAVVRIPDAVIADAAKPGFRRHIAIDRFTGGVLPGALYTMEVLEAGTFVVSVEPMEEMEEMEDERLREIRAVLRLVLHDLHEGIIGIGGGVARGYGSVRVGFDAAIGLPSLAEAQRTLGLMAGRR